MTYLDKRCTAKTLSGEPCQAPARAGRPYCFNHDPESAADSLKAKIKGGTHRRKVFSGEFRLPEGTDLKNAAGLAVLLEETINGVVKMEFSLNSARTIAQLSMAMKLILELGEISQRLERIESILNAEAHIAAPSNGGAYAYQYSKEA